MITSPEALREAVRALEADMARPGNMFAFDIAIVLSALQEAREALGPFAEAWSKHAAKPQTTAPGSFVPKADFRRAAEVYRALSPGGAEQ